MNHHTAGRRILPTLLLLGLAVVSACGDGGVCTADLVVGLSVTVVDAATGEEVPDPRFMVQIDGGEVEMLEDIEPTADGGYPLGYESGLYEVTIEADGYEPLSAEYDVTSDGCNPDTVSATVELVAIAP